MYSQQITDTIIVNAKYMQTKYDLMAGFVKYSVLVHKLTSSLENLSASNSLQDFLSVSTYPYSDIIFPGNCGDFSN